MLQLALFALFAAPPGFPEEDRFENVEEACQILSYEIPKEEHRGPVFLWCMWRSKHATRGGSYSSRVDGSLIHDMDRPAAWAMYSWGIRWGRINPGPCKHDRIDSTIPHPDSEKKLAKNWPFQFVPMDEAKRKRWMRHPYDAERYGTRGNHDNNMTVARGQLPGCWAPESLDRNDVAVTVTVMRAAAICEKFGCRSSRSIRRHWGSFAL